MSPEATMTAHVQEAELPSGMVLRVARIQRTDGSDGVVVERAARSDGPMQVLEPADERVTLTSDGARELRAMLEEMEV